MINSIMLDSLLSNSWLSAFVLNTFLITSALIVPKKLLTPLGYLHAWILGILVWGTLGWQGYLVVLFYLFVGSAVTKIGMAEKEAAGIAEARSGVRGPGNVWGSALTGTICALATLLVTSTLKELLILGYVASFATKLADTSATEVGKAYGKKTFLITTFKPVPRGTEGAVSVEGTVAGMIGAIAIAILSYGIGMINLWGVLWCTLAAFIATNIESLIGATLEQELSWLTHDLVNFLNTTIGAIAAILLTWLFNDL
jgi:uncharacterized protein (TIGR00297 family)